MMGKSYNDNQVYVPRNQKKKNNKNNLYSEGL